MKFEEVMPAFRRGERVRRAGWSNGHSKNTGACGYFYGEDLLADDWEVVQRPLTDEELAKGWDEASASWREAREYEVAEAYRICAHELRTRKVGGP